MPLIRTGPTPVRPAAIAPLAVAVAAPAQATTPAAESAPLPTLADQAAALIAQNIQAQKEATPPIPAVEFEALLNKLHGWDRQDPTKCPLTDDELRKMLAYRAFTRNTTPPDKEKAPKSRKKAEAPKPTMIQLSLEE